MIDIYAKIAGAVMTVALIFWSGWHMGGLGPREQLATANAAWQATEVKRLAQQKADQVKAETQKDNAVEIHTDDIQEISSVPVSTKPLRVCSQPSTARNPAVPVASQTDSQRADTSAGTVESGNGSDIRPAYEALKIKYEKVLADYRQLDVAWPR